MSQIHHFEVTTRDLSRRVQQFKNNLGFQVFAHRTGEQDNIRAVALHVNSIVVVIQTIELFNEVYNANGDNLPSTDWISNVTLLMNSSEFEKVFGKANECDSKITNCLNTDCSVQTGYNKTRTSNSSITRLFTLKSPFPSVYHTVMEGQCDCCSLMTGDFNKTNQPDWFTNTCLFGFTTCPSLFGNKSCHICDMYKIPLEYTIKRPLLSHVDHVTFACNTSTSSSLLKWYSDFLGFSEIVFVNTEGNKGFVLEGSNGMRLSAMQYWMCSEVCLKNAPHSDKSVQLIFAEPLYKSGPNQVQRFLDDNSGPGVQHIAFHTDDIALSVSVLEDNGVSFISPPPDYYSLIENTVQFAKTGENLTLLKKNKILIDVETGMTQDTELPDHTQYLLQVFSHSLFDRDTFFIELITRCGGAKGFGAGNMSVLWKSLDIHLRKCAVESD